MIGNLWGLIKESGKLIAMLATLTSQLGQLAEDVEKIEHELIRLDSTVEELARVVESLHK
jgi:predicted nuclease with TOPRIM domain